MSTNVDIAKLVHHVNNHICALNGEQTMAWEDLPAHMRDGLITTINGNETARQAHESWMKNRLENGWKLGPVKSIEDKISPCLIPYDELPYEQRIKDTVRCAIIEFLTKPWLFS